MKPVTISGIKALKVNYLDNYGFTEVQVRDILIKFGKEYEIDGPAYEMGATLEDFVDRFMNSEVEE